MYLNRYSFICRDLTTALADKTARKMVVIVVRGCFEFIALFIYSLVRGSRPGKNVQLTEAEVRGLCLKTREIFLSQPILLELEAPLKICGEFLMCLSQL